MSISIIDEKYNGLNALYANAGDWVDAEAQFSVRFYRGSGVGNKVTYTNQGGVYALTFDQDNWGDVYGFMDGDSITLTFTVYGTPPPQNPVVINATVSYVSGLTLYLTAPLDYPPPFSGSVFDGAKFPTDNLFSGMAILANKAPESAQFEFNLTPNGTSSLNSLIDSEINRFEIQGLDSIPASTPTAMTQLINKSGGLIKDVEIELLATFGDGYRTYKVTYKFFQWGIIQDGFAEPNYYNSSNCIAPIVRFKAFSQYGNPNGVISTISQNIDANTGGYDENYNGGVSLYEKLSIQWFDSLGNTIDALDYSGESTFIAFVSAPNQVNPASTYRLGLAWRPIDGSYYENKADTNVGENLLLNAPEVDFIADGVFDTNTYQGLEDENGARWDFKDIKFELQPNEVIITGTVIPNADAQALFATVPDGGRKSTLWVSLGDESLDGLSTSKRVSLKIFDEDNIDAPTLGVQIPDVIDEVLLDHDGNDITGLLPQTTTEDDVLYRSNFLLRDFFLYEGVRARIYAYNTVSEEEFTLEDIFFSFSNVPYITGQFQPNQIVNRGFNLPPLSDRNHISLVRNPSIDVAGKYGLTLEYGYLSRWEYWLEQQNVDNDFFDITQEWNGKNKNWQRFSNSGDWIVRLSYYTRLGGVDDFNHQEIGIRPYEDDADVSTVWGLEVLSSGATPSNPVADELHEVTATLTWIAGNFFNSWAEMTVEDFESGNRWVISSVLAQGGIIQNPLKPIAGQTGLDLTFPSANVAQLKAYLDTNVVSADKISMSARIYSGAFEYLITASKDAETAYSLRRVSNLTVYPDDLCIRVRRSSDDTEQDIGFVNNELDTASLLAFVGTGIDDNGFVTIWYDQSGSILFDAIQTIQSKQPYIVFQGAVWTGSNGKPAIRFNGSSHNFTFGATLAISQAYLNSIVFDRLSTGGGGILVGLSSNTLPNPYTQIIDFGNTLATGMSDASNEPHGAFNSTGSFNIISRRELANNDVNVRVNAVARPLGDYGIGLGGAFDGIGLNANQGGDQYNVCSLQELVFYKKDKSANESFIESNVNNYFNNY